MGSKDPAWDLNREQPWHRMAAHFFSVGDTAAGVARKVDRSQPAVHNLLRQPWFQKFVTQLMAERGDKDISRLFRAEDLNNYSTMVEMRDNPNTRAELKFKITQDMLDRSMGKATQRVEMSHETVSDDPVAEFNRLESENVRLRRELGEEQHAREASVGRTAESEDPI